MQQKHLQIRINQCLEIAKASNCPRAKFGALLLNPKTNVVLMDSYNGGPRGGTDLCAPEGCTRDIEKIPSGTSVEIGCHHAEMNLICNCSRLGVPMEDMWIIVSGEPCRMCAKLIHHCGVTQVFVVHKGYGGLNGIEYLEAHGIKVISYRKED